MIDHCAEPADFILTVNVNTRLEVTLADLLGHGHDPRERPQQNPPHENNQRGGNTNNGHQSDAGLTVTRRAEFGVEFFQTEADAQHPPNLVVFAVTIDTSLRVSKWLEECQRPAAIGVIDLLRFGGLNRPSEVGVGNASTRLPAHL